LFVWGKSLVFPSETFISEGGAFVWGKCSVFPSETFGSERFAFENKSFPSRFQAHYENTLCYDLAEKLCVTNSHQTPKIEKIILNASVSFKPQQVRGLATTSASTSGIRSLPKSKNQKTSGKSRGSGMLPHFGHGLEDCTLEVRKALILLSGQELDAKTFRVGRPHLGIRKGRLAAYQVTLRNQSMYLFLERLLTEVIPKVMKTDPAT
jgi:ribosomal protein L5